MVNQIQGVNKMAENVGTKELMEALDAVEALVVAGKAIMADGKINLDDLPAAMALLPQASKIVEGFKGLDALPAEAKDIREDEALEIVKKLYSIGAKLEA